MFLFHFQCKHDTIFLTILYPFILLGGSYYPMKNQEIIQDIVSYIYDAMRKKGLTSRGLAKICEEQGASLSSRTIDNMFKTPSSTTISTLLKICDGLELNLNAIFHSIEIAKTSNNATQQRLIYNIDNPAYNGYTGTYHVFFLPTSAYPEDHSNQTLVHGTLKLGDFYSTRECTAILDIDSGDFKADGTPFSKHYEGTLVYSTNSLMFCQLVCNQYGDMWFLVFDHGNLNNKELACVIGCAATSSSGRIRHPAIHRFCFCNMQQYPTIDKDTQLLIQGLLRIQNDRIFVEKETLSKFLEQEDLNSTFRMNVQNYLNIAKEYYALPKDVIRTELELSAYSDDLAKLCEKSVLEKTYHVKHSDDRELSCILRHNLTSVSKQKK